MTKISETHYHHWINDLKLKFQQAQIKASVKVNSTLLEYYWELGADIVEKQKNTTWGSGFLRQLSADLMTEFPSVKGFSERNLKFIRQWYLFYCNAIPKQSVSVSEAQEQKGKQAVSQLDLLFRVPWGHNIRIVQQAKDVQEALFYVQKTSEHNWSRDVLSMQIKSKLFEREGKAINNFDVHLPKPQSDLAKQIVKDPFNFEFLTLTQDFQEAELERGLVTHITQFLLELGQGFAYVGKQVKLSVEDDDFYLDLLFYHLKLRCYVVIELKAVAFKPEFAGKLNFYLSAVDEQIKHPTDNPTIGILLCKSKKKTIVEYALRNMETPMGVSEYQITHALPEQFKSVLPSVEEIEAELGGLDE